MISRKAGLQDLWALAMPVTRVTIWHLNVTSPVISVVCEVSTSISVFCCIVEQDVEVCQTVGTKSNFIAVAKCNILQLASYMILQPPCMQIWNSYVVTISGCTTHPAHTTITYGKTPLSLLSNDQLMYIFSPVFFWLVFWESTARHEWHKYKIKSGVDEELTTAGEVIPGESRKG